jgi:hypothetical protein
MDFIQLPMRPCQIPVIICAVNKFREKKTNKSSKTYFPDAFIGYDIRLIKRCVAEIIFWRIQ